MIRATSDGRPLMAIKVLIGVAVVGILALGSSVAATALLQPEGSDDSTTSSMRQCLEDLGVKTEDSKDGQSWGVPSAANENVEPQIARCEAEYRAMVGQNDAEKANFDKYTRDLQACLSERDIAADPVWDGPEGELSVGWKFHGISVEDKRVEVAMGECSREASSH